jgi:regulator of sigma E protease
VKFYGGTRNEDTPDDVEGLLYWQASVWKRAFIVAAGPAANFILAFLIFWGMVIHGIEQPPPTVGDVIEGSRAQQAGIVPGDRFVSVDGVTVKNWSDIERTFQKNPEKELDVVVLRGGRDVEKKLTPEAVVGRSIFGSKAKIGRVGVALGFPSAVVTITSADSPLARDGLKTGDRIESWLDEAGKSHKIQGLHETFKLFSEWGRNYRRPVSVSVRPISIAEGKDGRAQENAASEPRVVSLDAAKWPVHQGQTDRAYAASLGAVDSHLTVGLPRETLSGILEPGDRLASWNNIPIRNIFHLQEMMESWKSSEVSVVVVRNFKELSLLIPLKSIDVQAPEGLVQVYLLNAVMLCQASLPEAELLQERNPVIAAGVAINEAYKQTSVMLIGFWQIITGSVPIKSLGGPMMIAKVAGDSAKAGWMAFLASMAVISINLGLVNLFPIPLLDGGQLMLLGAEFIKRSPLEETTIENFQKLGFIMVMSLVILALYNDLSRFWGSIVGSMFGSK